MTFKKLIEARNAAEVMTFEIFIDDDLFFSTQAGNGADQVDRKFKQAKIKKAIENGADIKVFRTSKYGHEDITDLFLK